MNKLFFLLLVLPVISFAKSEWEIQYIDYEGSKIRTGIKKQASNVLYKGSILYLQGLGDSMLNHDPLFDELNENGYEVIAFDYRGQGGSEGTMNSTRIKNINDLSEYVWKLYKNPTKKKIIIGWSTGGLAAYRYAYKNPDLTKAVILLAPGIAPKLFIGETSLLGCLSTISIYMGGCKFITITKETLTQNRFTEGNDPHIDPIKPKSPVKVPLFATDLLKTAHKSKDWKISSEVAGMVYLSSNNDTYVNAKKTINVIEENARHFEYYQFGNGALHELDNEIDEVSDYLKSDIIRFLDAL